MARIKTASHARSQSPPNAANNQPSDHSPLNETPHHTILQDVIIPASDPPKSSKPKTSKKSTKRSQRMRKGSSSKPTTSHVDLVSVDDKKENEEMNEASDEETISEKGNIFEKTEKVEEEPSEKAKEVAIEEVNLEETEETVGTKGVSQNHLLSFDDNKVLKIINWIC